VFPQPVAKSFRKFDEGSLRWKVGGIVSRISSAIQRPLSAIRRG
jgi:hypothetical protein